MVAMTTFYRTIIRYTRLLFHLVAAISPVALRRTGIRLVDASME
jgi:hypothetical protein